VKIPSPENHYPKQFGIMSLALFGTLQHPTRWDIYHPGLCEWVSNCPLSWRGFAAEPMLVDTRMVIMFGRIFLNRLDSGLKSTRPKKPLHNATVF
jgi:hypothetical protein